MTDGLLCFVSQSWASPEPVQLVPLVCLSVCLSISLSAVTTATAVWKDDDAEVIIQKITHMSRRGNRQFVSGIGGNLCVHTSVCLDYGTVRSQVCGEWRITVLSLLPPVPYHLGMILSSKPLDLRITKTHGGYMSLHVRDVLYLHL